MGIKVPGENRFLYIGSAILGAVLVSIFALGQYRVSLESNLKQVNDQLVVLERSRNKKAEQNLKILNDRLAVTAGLMDNHIYWSKALSRVENLLQSQVQFESIAGIMMDHKVNIRGKTTGFTVLARQIAAFLSGEGILDVSLDKVTSLPTGRLEFEMRIDFDKSKFTKK